MSETRVRGLELAHSTHTTGGILAIATKKRTGEDNELRTSGPLYSPSQV